MQREYSGPFKIGDGARTLEKTDVLGYHRDIEHNK
jgi:hypothetical protein